MTEIGHGGGGEEIAVLETAGLSPEQEATYLALLESPGSTVAAIARGTGRPVAATRTVLEQLTDLGFVEPTREWRYAPVPPREAVGALVERRLEELAEARRAAAALAEQFPSPPERAAPDVAHVVVGREAVEAQFIQVTRACAHELLVFDRPPYAQRPAAANTTETNALARGVQVRGLYAPEAFELPGALDQARAAVAAGEQARAHAALPLKLVIADRTVAMLSLDETDPGSSALVLRSRPAVTALVRLFESLWAEGTELHLLPEETPARGPVGDTGDQRDRLVSLLAAGLKDEAIARDLGVSARTVGRRVSSLLEDLGVRTRFQAGMRVARELVGPALDRETEARHHRDPGTRHTEGVPHRQGEAR